MSSARTGGVAADAGGVAAAGARGRGRAGGALASTGCSAARGRQRSLLRGRGRAPGAPLPPHGRALYPRWAAHRDRAHARGALGRPPRGGRVRASGDRGQAGAAGHRAHRRRRAAWPARPSCSSSPETSSSPSGSDDPRDAEAGEVGAAVRSASRARMPDDRVRPVRRGMGVRPTGRRPARRPGAGGDALPRAVGAGPRLLRASRPARQRPRGRRVTTRARRPSCTRSSASARATSKPCSRTCAARC